MAEVAVRELADHDVPFVKLWVEDRDGFQIPGRKGPFVLTPDISKAAVAEADRHGLRTMAHVKTVAELKDLLRAGVDMWTHPIADAPADEELLALLRERPGLWYVPVLTPGCRGMRKDHQARGRLPVSLPGEADRRVRRGSTRRIRYRGAGTRLVSLLISAASWGFVPSESAGAFPPLVPGKHEVLSCRVIGLPNILGSPPCHGAG